MPRKQRRTKATGNRAVTESITEMIAKMNPGTLDRMEGEVWARLDRETRYGLTIRREVAISEMFSDLHPADATEVESLMLARLTEEQRTTILTDRTRGIGMIIGDSVGKMTPNGAQEVEQMISAALERQDRDEEEAGPLDGKPHDKSPWWRAVR